MTIAELRKPCNRCIKGCFLNFFIPNYTNTNKINEKIVSKVENGKYEKALSLIELSDKINFNDR